MAKDIWNCEDNMAVRNVEHAFGEGVSTLHVVEVSTGRAETGLAGEWNPTDLIAAVTAVHSAVFRIPAVEYFFDFGNDNGSKMKCLQHREPVTENFEEEGNAL